MNKNFVNTLSKVFIFAAGAAVGCALTYKYFATRYQIVDEEVTDTDGDAKEEKHESEGDLEGNPVSKAANDMIIEKMNYASFAKKNEKKEGDDENMDKPYVISPEDFDTNDYKTKSLVLYNDGVLVNEFGIPVNKVDELIGEESLTHFGEYEEDSVFVRNDKLKTDFEILRDGRNYNEAAEEE